MGNPYIYWYPVEGNTLEQIDLGEPISDLQWEPIRVVGDGIGSSGSQYRASFMGGLLVRIVHQQFDDEALAMKLENLQTHLERGGLIGFSRDHDTTWASHAVNPPARGIATTLHGGNFFASWSTSAALTANDWMVLESANPELTREFVQYSSASGNTITWANAVKNDFNEAPVIVRSRDFYPALALPESQIGRPMLSHDRRRTWTWDATLMMDYATIAAITSNSLLGTTLTSAGAGGLTLSGARRVKSGRHLRSFSGARPGLRRN